MRIPSVWADIYYKKKGSSSFFEKYVLRVKRSNFVDTLETCEVQEVQMTYFFINVIILIIIKSSKIDSSQAGKYKTV